jgi:hypothetical protein
MSNHHRPLLRRTRHGVLAAKDSPIVLHAPVTSEFITSLKRSSTGVNCFLDTWTFFISSSWGDLLIPLFTGVFLIWAGSYWSLFICFLHALLLAVAPRTECLLGTLLCQCRWVGGGGILQHKCCQGETDIMPTHAWVGNTKLTRL